MWLYRTMHWNAVVSFLLEPFEYNMTSPRIRARRLDLRSSDAVPVLMGDAALQVKRARPENHLDATFPKRNLRILYGDFVGRVVTDGRVRDGVLVTNSSLGPRSSN